MNYERNKCTDFQAFRLFLGGYMLNEYRKINAQFIGTDEWLNNDLRVYYISDNNIRTYTTVNIVGL